MNAPPARIDGSLYLSVPRVNALSGLSLARAILIALPKAAPASVKHAARAMRAQAVALQDACTAQRSADKTPATRSAREVDNEADALHGAIKRRLGDYEIVSARHPDVAARARDLSAKLYPEKSDITHGTHLAQWQETELWFGTLAEGDNDAALRALVGAPFVDALRATHVEYGEAVGTTKPRAAEAPKVDVAGPLTALLNAIQDLALQLVAAANEGSASDELRKAARAALVPIDEVREANARRAARRGADDGNPAEPDAPIPDVK
jgi:hypothetical protein